MSQDLIAAIRSAESALRGGDAVDARRQLSALRRRLSLPQAEDDGGQAVDRYQQILSRTLQVTTARGLSPVADEVLDGLIAVVGAERGFLGLVQPDGSWRFLAARKLSQEDVEDPAAQVSTAVIRQALDERTAVAVDDAGSEFADSESVMALRLRSVACLPLLSDDRVLGFVYLDSRASHGLFDQAAVSAARAWLPFLAQSLARALQELDPAQAFPGVVTRSAVMHATLDELARIAAYDASVLLTGETGTGKSLIASQLHAASPRSAGPFVHLNCGAIPESLIESELFGHIKGAFTGATADRTGKLQAARGGTLFLDELDSMPVGCQVKLLVALQERRVTPVGGTTPVEVDLRVIAATGAPPFEAIDQGSLREDLYYRLAVFEAALPPLRERPEDLPVLASHFLEQSRQRYGLPPLRLSDHALDTLVEHDWPGNVRELANALDRAALLARDGVVQEVRLPRARPSTSGGILQDLEQASRALVGAMAQDESLRSWETAELFKALVLLVAVEEHGSKEAGFDFLGLGKLVEHRNHHRAFKREADRVEALSEALGERASAALLALMR